uniref:Uncharacterized protein n=1 Tax=Globodera rostochiensis TaxID=31243 RepID=A0A914I1L4_GLORO
MQFITTLCTVKTPENEGNSEPEIVPSLNTGLAAPNVHNLDESLHQNHPTNKTDGDSERGEPSLNSWASFDDVHGKKHEMTANPEFPTAEKPDQANESSVPWIKPIEINAENSTFSHKVPSKKTDQDEELDDVYEVLIKDWDDEDDSKNDSTSAGEAQKESDQNDVKILNTDKNIEAITESEHNSEQSSSSTFSINIDPNNGDQNGDEITQIGQNAVVLSEDEAKTYAQNAKLIDQLNSGNNDGINQMPTTDKFASKLMPTKLSRAFSKSKSLRSESAKNSSYKNENEGTSPQNEMNISSPILRSDSFTFEQHHRKKSPSKKHFEIQSDTEPTAVGIVERTPSHRRNKSTESMGLKSAEKDYLPKTEKELLVDTLNAAMNSRTIQQQKIQYISQWKCAKKYWTKYLVNFLWRDEQSAVGLCKAWARIDAKVGEILDAWKPLSTLPMTLVQTFLVTDKLEVDIGGVFVNINEIIEYLRKAHECIFEGKKETTCQNAKIVNANEWDQQIKQFKSEAKKLSSPADKKSQTFPVGPRPNA